MPVDESALLWAAALVDGTDPAELLARMDVAALARITAHADAVDGPVDAAARLLVAVVRERPFPSGNAAAGWLAAVDLLAAARCRVTAGPAAVVDLCDGIRSGTVGGAEVARALRGWLVEDGFACPACGRRVYAGGPEERRLAMPGLSRFELVARCAYEHGRHGRSGRMPTAPRPGPVERRQPVLARGACGSFLVAGSGSGLVVSPFCDDPPVLRVVEVGEVRPGELVGRWDRLVERSSTLGFVDEGDARPDGDERIDLVRLRTALRRSRLAGAGV